MTLNFTDESGLDLGIPMKEIAEEVIRASMEELGCPYEIELNLLVTGAERIRELNRTTRGIDRVTDVLSFPMLDFENSGDFSFLRSPEEREEKQGTAEEDCSFADAFSPYSGELILGDIVICAPRLLEQAEEYGHSTVREFAFLTAHSLLHLSGFDHMEEEERLEMESFQRRIMARTGILR